MIPKFFGQFLLERRIITAHELCQAIDYQYTQKQMMGELAVKDGLMTEEQVNAIRHLQKATDRYFGELAVEKKYITDEQLKKLMLKQKNSHIFLGDALVKLGILSSEEIQKQLENFREDQKGVDDMIDIPLRHPLKEYFYHFIDLTIKLLRRMAHIDAKIGEIEIRELETVTRPINAVIQFSEDLTLHFLLGLSAEAGEKIASEFLEENIDDPELIRENTGEFLNVVCGNIATKLQMLGIKTQISVPHIFENNEKPFYQYTNNGKALVIPLITNYGNCELQIILKELEVYVGNKKAVLIVDDSKSVAYKLTKIIERLNDFEVAGHAKDGKEALELYRKLKPDLVTMDIVLPDKTGLEVIKEIKEEFPDANIIVISSVGGSQDKLFQAIQAGAKNVIVKPFEEDTVREIFIQSV